jgi:type II secretory pathway pseudopilin PulG
MRKTMPFFSAGFTLIETIVAIGVLVLLAVVIISGFVSLRGNTALESTGENIVALLSEARSKTLASEESSQYGVHFEANRAVFFKGASFMEGQPDNDEFLISSLVEISDINLDGGGPDVIFKKLTGKTDNYGTITLALKANPAKTKDIVIQATGIISNE